MIAHDGSIKLSDFGLARIVNDEASSLSHQVATRWYRSPELLYASRSYDVKVDVWAVGCIFAELITLGPLFAGNNDIDQMFRVFQVLGTPNEENWPVSTLIRYHLIESLVIYSIYYVL